MGDGPAPLFGRKSGGTEVLMLTMTFQLALFKHYLFERTESGRLRKSILKPG